VQTLSGWVSDAVPGRVHSLYFLDIRCPCADLGAVGIYGAFPYSVPSALGNRHSHRLGARRPEVLLPILRQSALLALAGIASGSWCFLPDTAEASLLYGVSRSRPGDLLRCFRLAHRRGIGGRLLPARRAMRVDPVVPSAMNNLVPFRVGTACCLP